MKIAFALEYSLGHITHSDNLKAALVARPDIDPCYIDIPYDNTPLPAFWRNLGPINSNWTVRASLAAAHGLRSCKDVSVAFFHTQVTALLSAGYMRRVPSVVSLDATPIQFDALGTFGGWHEAGTGPLEAVKKKLNLRAYNAASHLVTWSQWTKDSLTQDYGINPLKVTVIPPGIDLTRWTFTRETNAGPIRILFVGGDFLRKGGDTLLQAFQLLRCDFPDATLSVVTKSENAGDGMPGVTVHRGLTPNSPALLGQYEAANIFAFPTRGDCLPLAVMEALASGLPVVTTCVGALAEAVEDGLTGSVVEPNDPVALATALAAFASDPDRITRMSAFCSKRAAHRFDSAINYNRLIDLLIGIAGSRI